uniref:Putative three prime repair exonuclease 1 n=1 Tax=Anopheles marajoara TaxID=58244 RepID=A0A2M4BR06_9DIPT
MTNIKSFAFLDLETTGLPEYEFSRTKITELSVVACSREHLQLESTLELPRVVHKLSLCFNPFRMISHKSSQSTGLYNDLLQHEGLFDANAGELLRLFLSRLQKPVCLVAHNGYRFDFILLKKQLTSIGITLEAGSVVCIDSIAAFRSIEADIERSTLENCDGLDDAVSELEYRTVRMLDMLQQSGSAKEENSRQSLTPPSEEIERKHKQAVQAHLAVSPGEYNRNGTASETMDEMLSQPATMGVLECLEVASNFMADQKKRNEKTPQTSRTGREEDNEDVEDGFFEQTQKPAPASRPCTSSRARKRLFPADSSTEGTQSTQRRRYNLTELYKRTVGRDLQNAHRAEQDTMALLECVAMHAERFIVYAEAHCVPFESIKGSFY